MDDTEQVEIRKVGKSPSKVRSSRSRFALKEREASDLHTAKKSKKGRSSAVEGPRSRNRERGRRIVSDAKTTTLGPSF